MNSRKIPQWVGTIGVFVLAALAIGDSPVLAADGGVLACGGTNIIVAGPDRSYTVYRLDNFDDAATILIERVVVYADDGELICDFPAVDDFPARFTDLLGSHQTTRMTTLDMHPTPTGAGCLPLQSVPADPDGVPRLTTFFYWSFLHKGDGNRLAASHTDVYQDTTTAHHIGRSSAECREVEVK